MSDEYDNHHGHSVAAWAGVGTILLGFLIGSLGVIFANWWVIGAGVVICALGVVVGKVLSMAGYGQSKVAHDRDGVG